MDLAVTHPMTLEAFLAWEEAQEDRYEFDGEQPVLMTGGTKGHAIIAGNILLGLRSQFAGTSFRAYVFNMKVTPTDRSRYPDLIVSAVPGLPSDTIEHNPIVLFEVLSPSTRRTDLVAKNAEYRTLPTLQRYIMLEQESAIAFSVHRVGSSGWAEQRLAGLAALLDMPEIGAVLALRGVYADVLTA